MNIRTNNGMTTTTVDINQSFTPAAVRRAVYYNPILGVDAVDISVAVIPRNTSDNTLVRKVITVPASRLLTGKQYANIRTIRFNHLLNILNSLAAETEGVDVNSNHIAFLGFI